jgi:hypothetical protein
MLWTDSIFLQPSDLTRIDGEALGVAGTERIILPGPNGLLRAAQEEAAMEINKYVVAFGGYLNSGDLSSNHLAAVLNVGIGNSVRQKALLVQVSVTDGVQGSWSWIYQFGVYWALKALYRNAFSRTVLDRYKQKLDYFTEELDDRVRGNIKSLGIPIVLQPLSAPGAFFEANSGTWGDANVSLVTGSGTAVTPFDVAITYCDMSQANRYVSVTLSNNAESAPSAIVSVSPQGEQVISVDIDSLNPPTGAQSPASLLVCVVALMVATHWNVYVGLSGETLYLQNSSPIPIATTSYTLASDPVLGGHQLGLGQYPTRRLSVVPLRQRA